MRFMFSFLCSIILNFRSSLIDLYVQVQSLSHFEFSSFSQIYYWTDKLILGLADLEYENDCEEDNLGQLAFSTI